MRMERDGSEDLSTCQWICDLSWPTNPLQVNWKVPKPRHTRNWIWFVWMEVKVWVISWIVCKAVRLSIIPFVSESYKLKWVQRNIHQRHWFGGVCMITFMSVSSFPISQEVTAKCSNFLRSASSSLDWGRNSPDFALFDGVHGTAQGTDKVSCKIWTVREGALEIKCDNCNLFGKARKFYLKSPERGTSLDCVRRSWSSSPETCSDILSTTCWRRWEWASCNS